MDYFPAPLYDKEPHLHINWLFCDKNEKLLLLLLAPVSRPFIYFVFFINIIVGASERVHLSEYVSLAAAIPLYYQSYVNFIVNRAESVVVAGEEEGRGNKVCLCAHRERSDVSVNKILVKGFRACHY
jgi:hypothetical protein